MARGRRSRLDPEAIGGRTCGRLGIWTCRRCTRCESGGVLLPRTFVVRLVVACVFSSVLLRADLSSARSLREPATTAIAHVSPGRPGSAHGPTYHPARRMPLESWLIRGRRHHRSPRMVAAAAPPENLVPPVVSGVAQDGQTLKASPGTWSSSGRLTYRYQLQLCSPTGTACTSIATARSSSYRLSSAGVGHEMTVVVTATTRPAKRRRPRQARWGL